MRPIEGWAVRDKRGIIYYVSGIEQPKDGLWVYPKYVPATTYNYDRIIDNRPYLKLRSFHEILEWMFKNLRGKILKFDNRSPLIFLRWKEIVKVYDPREKLRGIITGRSKSRIEEAAASLAMALSSLSGVPISNFGISGSILIDASLNTSDIDLVCYYREDELKNVYSAAARLRAMNVTKSLPEDVLKKLYSDRFKETPSSWDIFKRIESRKLLQGIYYGFQYNIKLIWPFNMKHKRWNKERVEGIIIEDERRYLFPSEYVIKTPGGIYRVYSFRFRFCEYGMKRERILVEGWATNFNNKIIVIDHIYGNMSLII